MWTTLTLNSAHLVGSYSPWPRSEAGLIETRALKFVLITLRASSIEYTTRVMPSVQRMTRPVRASFANRFTSATCMQAKATTM